MSNTDPYYSKPRVLSLKEAYSSSLAIAGSYARKFACSINWFICGYILQGAAYCCFFPLLTLAFADQFDQTPFWYVLMAVFCLGDICCRWFAHEFDYTGTVIGVTHELRLKLGVRLRQMPLEELQSYRSGELNAILAGNVEEAVLHMGVISSLLLQTIIVPAVVILVTLHVDWKISLMILAMFALVWPVTRYLRSLAGQEYAACSKANSALEAETVEYIQGLPVLRSFNAIGRNAENLNEAVCAVRKIQSDYQLRLILPSVLIAAIVEIGFIVILLAGVVLWSGQHEVGGPILAAVALILSRFSEPISTLAQISSVVDYVETAFQNIQSIFSKKDLPTLDSSIDVEATPEAAVIAFENVSFRYARQSKDTLENFTLSFPPNAMTALVGLSGSGKTTITRLLTRYADPQQGRITLGGRDIRSFSQQQLMRYFSVVFQDVYLFNDTVANNIFMGKQAVPTPFCDSFISRLPEGYNSQLGDIGGTLSGGERQRISIARAIVKNAPIVILDEPTAALDAESERIVQESIDALVANRTVIVIAHRLATIMQADQIVVLENGRINGVGSHQELLDKNSRYRTMWRAQQRTNNGCCELR